MPGSREHITAVAQEMARIEGFAVSRTVVRIVLDSMLAAIAQNLSHGERVRIRGFGTFRVVMSEPRIGINPRNPSIKIPIPAHRQVKFKAGSALKAMLN